MNRRNAPFWYGKAAAACVLGLTLSLQAPSVAFATTKEDLRQQMEQARQTIATLSSEAELAEYDLLTVSKQLENTNQSIAELDSQIPDTRGQLDTARSELAAIISDNYKNGTPTLLDVFMDTVSFDDLVLRIEYANKVAEYKRGVLDEVKGLSNELELQMNELENDKANQEALKSQHAQRLEAADKAASAAASYYNSLSQELQQMIAEERAAEQAAAQAAAAQAVANAQRLAAAEAAARSQQGNAQSGSTNSGTQQNAQSSQQQNQNVSADSVSAAPIQQQSPEPIVDENPVSDTNENSSEDNWSYDFSSSYEYGGGSIVEVGVSDSVSEFVSRAFSIVGAGYQWSGYSWTGNPFSSAFTCSGVIDFARGYPSRSSSPESLYSEVGPRMVYDTSKLNYGDLCFYAYGGRNPTGHVGIYIGGGQIIDSIPNGGVSIRDVNYMTFVGGGPIF